MIEQLVDDVFAHAEQEQPNECCGLAVIVKGRLKYFPCKNLSSGDQFLIDPEDYANAEDKGEIVGICHSHVYIAPEPSQADKVMCERTGLPWLIVNYPTKAYKIVQPEGYEAPLVGRTFAYGVLDCYELVRDYYKQTLGIELSSYDTEESWWKKGQNHYEENFEKEGFVKVGYSDFKDVKEHDIFLMKVASPVINHAAIYVGDNKILHHCYKRLSSKDVFGGYWQKSTEYVVRHKSLL